MNNWLTLSDLYESYLDCRRKKRNTHSCAAFERNEATNLMKLYRDLNGGHYEIGYSNAFCVTRPKVREIFASDFRDRIVHHLLIMKTMPLFEQYFIDDSYNCRKGKGTMYGHKRLAEIAQRHKGDWVLCLDLRNFFCTIPKRRLADELEEFLRERYNEADKEQIIALTKQVALHRPQDKCVLKGNLKIFDTLPRDKSLLTCDDSRGMAIGNLTSQIYANYYLTKIDKFIVGKVGDGRYGRYVDDLRLIGARNELVALIPQIREKLKAMGLELHPKKWELQPIYNGFGFVGVVIKQGRMYIGNRTVGNMQSLILRWNKKADKYIDNNIEKFAQSYNSYTGYLKHYKTYAIRWKMWNLVSDRIKKYTYLTGNMSVLKVRNKYKQITKYRENYDTKRLHCKLRETKTNKQEPLLGEVVPS